MLLCLMWDKVCDPCSRGMRNEYANVSDTERTRNTTAIQPSNSDDETFSDFSPGESLHTAKYQ